jgi:hypothetical protein
MSDGGASRMRERQSDTQSRGPLLSIGSCFLH